MSKKLVKDLENIIESGLNSVVLPYTKGNSIRIKNVIVRKSSHGYLIFDSETNKSLAKTFCKTSAVAIAKNYAEGKNIIARAMQYDKIIEKNYNDAIFYRNILKNPSNPMAESRIARLEIAMYKTRFAKDHLDEFIFGS